MYWWRSKLTNPQIWRYFQTNSTSLKMSPRYMNKPVQLHVWKSNHQTFCTVNLVFIRTTANKACIVMTFDPIIHTRAQRWASNLQSFLPEPCWHFSAVQVQTVLVADPNYRYGRKQGSLQSVLWKHQLLSFFTNSVNFIFFFLLSKISHLTLKIVMWFSIPLCLLTSQHKSGTAMKKHLFHMHFYFISHTQKNFSSVRISSSQNLSICIITQDKTNS